MSGKAVPWEEIPESEMPSLAGTVLRRFLSGEKMTVARVTFTEGAAVSEHTHENEQYTLVLSGRMEFRIEGETVVVGAGEVLHLPSNVRHGAKALEPSVLLDVFSPPRADWNA
jgi:quercetin dioxygenase-like cupin family protein